MGNQQTNIKLLCTHRHTESDHSMVTVCALFLCFKKNCYQLVTSVKTAAKWKKNKLSEKNTHTHTFILKFTKKMIMFDLLETRLFCSLSLCYYTNFVCISFLLCALYKHLQLLLAVYCYCYCGIFFARTSLTHTHTRSILLYVEFPIEWVFSYEISHFRFIHSRVCCVVNVCLLLS